MASESRQHPGVLKDIFDAPWEWDFFQALRQIECAHPENARLGTSRTLCDDPVRFGQYISMAFATSTLEKEHEECIGPPPEHYVGDTAPPLPPLKLLVRFSGLTGPNGPLPLVLTEFIRNRLTGVDDPDFPRTLFGTGTDIPQKNRRDPALAEFVDLFHHRLISLFYRAWALASKTVDFDRQRLSSEPKEEDGGNGKREETFFAEWIGSLFGNGLPEFDGADSIPSWQKLAFAGHLATPTRHMSGLRGVLTDAFATGSEVQALIGQWVLLPEAERCRLGETPRTGVLGVSCMVGSKFWSREFKIKLRLGPMPYAEYRTYLPGGKCQSRLQDWVAFYIRRQFDWEAAIVLKREEVPPCKLGGTAQLGRTAWISSDKLGYDPEDYRIG